MVREDGAYRRAPGVGGRHAAPSALLVPARLPASYGRRDRRMHAVEARWLERIETARLYLYRMPDDTFTQDPEVAAY